MVLKELRYLYWYEWGVFCLIFMYRSHRPLELRRVWSEAVNWRCNCCSLMICQCFPPGMRFCLQFRAWWLPSLALWGISYLWDSRLTCFFSFSLSVSSTVPGWICICTKQGGEVFVHLRDGVHIPGAFTGECTWDFHSPISFRPSVRKRIWTN